MSTVEEGRRATPPLVELERIYRASRAVEKSQETSEDLKYLQGKGTSLGGMRPKCTVLDENGRLAIGKFPSVSDARSVTRGEVLAMRLASAAGIEAAAARTIDLGGTAIALIDRFDRTEDFARIHYLSAASMLQASRVDDRSYTEIADLIRSRCQDPTEDVRQLWRRMVFSLFITNVDDHLQNHGFLFEGRGLWRLAPAFDLNPFPDKDRESKTWLLARDRPDRFIADAAGPRRLLWPGCAGCGAARAGRGDGCRLQLAGACDVPRGGTDSPGKGICARVRA